MKRFYLQILLFIIFSNLCYSQYNNWIFDNYNNVKFDLISELPNYKKMPRKDVSYYYSTMSDKKGNLLFYTNGIIVRNKDNEIMENGTGLFSWHVDLQNSLILPVASDTNLFYIFTVGNFKGDSGLCYSIVDLSYNDGLGKVIVKNKSIIKNVSSRIAAVHHNNGRDYWIVVYSKDKPILYSILFSENGNILKSVENKVGTIKNDPRDLFQGWLRFSPTGNKLASLDYSRNGLIELFSFNTNTGIINNPVRFRLNKDVFKENCEFSPNEKYLYLSTSPFNDIGGIYQFDISSHNADDIVKSGLKIYDSYKTHGMQLAIDGAIYFNALFTKEINNYLFRYLSKICFPDRRGEKCEIIPDALMISDDGGRLGLANIPADYCNNVCDDHSFDFFNMNSSEFLFIGEAKPVGDIVRLTTSNEYVKGAFWYNKKINLLNGFVSDFKFRFSQGNNNNSLENSYPGADGFAFVIQNTSLNEIGKAGGGIGYDGIPNSIAFEFDMYKNKITDSLSIDDPNGNHFAIQNNSNNPNSSSHLRNTLIYINNRIPIIKSDSTPYFVRFIYKPGTLLVYLDTSRSYAFPPICKIENFYIDNYLDLASDSSLYIGFTAATGKAYQIQDIEEWYLCLKQKISNDITKVKKNYLNLRKVTLAPNPATDYIEITVDNHTLQGMGGDGGDRTLKDAVKVYNVLGVEVLTASYTPPDPLSRGGNMRLDVSGLPAGVYFVRLGGKMMKFVKM